jgi:CHRD domain
MARRTGLVAAVAILGALALGVLASIGTAGSSDNGNQRMIGYFEVPSVSTVARGRFELRIRDDEIDYTLTYSGLEAAVAQAHIHFAQPGVNGGITAWLCEATATSPQPDFDTQCPQSGTVTGTITASDVLATPSPTAAQGIAAGEFAEFVRAIRAGFTYANVHSAKFPGGEIRTQIKARGSGDDDDDD